MRRPLLLLVVLACGAAGCAAPLSRPATSASTPPPAVPQTRPAANIGRPAVGVAFGGGSARGIAHVGVIRWLEEHRIPVDLAAGTSMGGLIGGAFSTGMDAADLDEMVASLDWDHLFGSSSFGFKNIRRKADGRAFPSRLEFGLKRGIVPPTSLNNGEQVDLLLGRIAGPYYGIATFDELPTPFRAVAVDLLSASQVVLDRGPLAIAMRATMSLPLIFPPVEVDGRVLVDGGAMNNVPANVVRAMGADRVVAVNVGDLTDREAVNTTMIGLAGATLDAMMRASTRASMADADVVIDVPLQDFGSLDWRRSTDLIAAGYQAAESKRDELLTLAVSEAEYERWRAGRQARRLTALPVPAFVTSEGFTSGDEARLGVLMAPFVGSPFDVEIFQDALAILSGLDRYQSITWQIVTHAGGEHGLLVRARPKPYAPPFMMLGLNLENTTSSDFRITVTGRYLSYDLFGSGSELRLDGTLGSDPGLAGEIYRPLGATALFVAPYANLSQRTLNVVDGDAVIARYGLTATRIGVNLGVNLGRQSDLRAGMYVGRVDAEPTVGDPGLPALKGKETGAELVWRFDGQDSPVIPGSGTFATSTLRHIFDEPDVAAVTPVERVSSRVTQLSASTTRFWTVRERGRVFATGGIGTSFDGTPLPTDQFSMGSVARLGAYALGELRGNHYYAATGGYLMQFARLPDFLGGPVFVGSWLENGDAFDQWNRASLRTNLSVGAMADTLIGPMIVAGSAGFDGRWRTYVGVGRIFR